MSRRAPTGPKAGTIRHTFNKSDIERYIGTQEAPQSVVIDKRNCPELGLKWRICIYDCSYTKVIITEPVARIDLSNCQFVTLQFVSCATSVELDACRYCDIKWDRKVGTVSLDNCMLCTINIPADEETKAMFILNQARCVGTVVRNNGGLKIQLPDYHGASTEGGGDKYLQLSINNIIEEHLSATMRKKFLHPRSITFLSDLSISCFD